MVSPGRGIKSLSNTVPVMIYNVKPDVVVPQCPHCIGEEGSTAD